MILSRNDCFDVTYEPERSALAREKKCQNTRNVNTRYIERLIHSGYVEEKQFTCERERGDYFSLTRSAFNILTGIMDWQEEYRRQELTDKTLSKMGKSALGTNQTPSEDALRQIRYLDSLRSPSLVSDERKRVYDQILYEAICAWDLTPLAFLRDTAHSVSHMSYQGNSRQRKRALQITNIIAAFRQNQYLTCLDRRPLDDVRDEAAEERAGETLPQPVGEQDVFAYATKCLKAWYKAHPESWLFFNPGEPMQSNWGSVPTFYDFHEIPGLYADSESEQEQFTGKKNILRYTALGLAVGATANYIVYHASSRPLRWNYRIEFSAIETVQKIYEQQLQNYNLPSLGRSVRYAIMFCESVYQFESFFWDITHPQSKQHRPGNIPAPYTGLFAILVNSAGLQQLRMLMEFGPVNFTRNIIREICQIDQEYSRKNNIAPSLFPVNDAIFQLSFHDTPVLCAYDLEIGKLRDAVAEYLLGRKFYVACYPEQMKFIRRIMPDVEFI